MKKLVRLIFWLVLALMMMPLLGCTTPANYKDGCIAWPVGGKPIAEAYRNMNDTDRKAFNEWSNRLYKTRQLPVFCQ